MKWCKKIPKDKKIYFCIWEGWEDQAGGKATKNRGIKDESGMIGRGHDRSSW